MSTASKGRAAEWKVRDMLIAEGFDVGRFAGSKGGTIGPVDLIALRPVPLMSVPPYVVLASVKCNHWPGREEMRQLARLSIRYPRPGHEVRIYRKRDRKPMEGRIVKG